MQPTTVTVPIFSLVNIGIRCKETWPNVLSCTRIEPGSIQLLAACSDHCATGPPRHGRCHALYVQYHAFSNYFTLEPVALI